MSTKVRAKTPEEVEAQMQRRPEKKNCNEEGDITSSKKREYRTVPPVSGIMRVIKNVFKDLPEQVERNIATARDSSKTYYSDRAIVLIPALLGVLGKHAISSLGMLGRSSAAIRNISRFCKQDLEEVPDYQTVTNALSQIKDLDGCNDLYGDTNDTLFKSNNYKQNLPTFGYSLLRSEDGTFPTVASRLLQVIGDGVETFRSLKQQSPRDLVYIHKDSSGEPVRTEYAHKFMVFIAKYAPGFLVPFCAAPIENPEGWERTDQSGEKQKQNSETAVTKQLLERIHGRWKDRKFLFQFDALSLTKPLITMIVSFECAYIITLKEGSAPALYREAMKQFEKDRRDFVEGKRTTDPVIRITSNGIEMRAQFIEDVGRLTGDKEWDKLPVHVAMVLYNEEIEIFNEKRDQHISTRKGRKEARERNEQNPQKDFTESECRGLLKAYFKRNRPKVTDKEFEEIVEGAVFRQRRDKVTGCRIVDVRIERRFLWATNIIVDLKNHPEALKLVAKEVTDNHIAKKSPGNMAAAQKKVTGYVEIFISCARDRWSIEEVFNLLKNGGMRIERRKSKQYQAEKAYFYIALLSWMILSAYRYYDKYAAKVLKGKWKDISDDLLVSFMKDEVEEGSEYIERRTCMRAQLIE